MIDLEVIGVDLILSWICNMVIAHAVLNSEHCYICVKFYFKIKWLFYKLNINNWWSILFYLWIKFNRKVYTMTQLLKQSNTFSFQYLAIQFLYFTCSPIYMIPKCYISGLEYASQAYNFHQINYIFFSLYKQKFVNSLCKKIWRIFFIKNSLI